jgi:hypothetical protein
MLRQLVTVVSMSIWPLTTQAESTAVGCGAEGLSPRILERPEGPDEK